MDTEEGTTEHRQLSCKLTTEEIAHRADELAREVAKHAALEQGKKDQAKAVGMEIAEVESGIFRLAEQVRTKSEERVVVCAWQRDEDGRRLDCVRQDTGEIVASRSLTQSELQGKLFTVRGEVSMEKNG